MVGTSSTESLISSLWSAVKWQKKNLNWTFWNEASIRIELFQLKYCQWKRVSNRRGSIFFSILQHFFVLLLLNSSQGEKSTSFAFCALIQLKCPKTHTKFTSTEYIYSMLPFFTCSLIHICSRKIDSFVLSFVMFLTVRYHIVQFGYLVFTYSQKIMVRALQPHI